MPDLPPVHPVTTLRPPRRPVLAALIAVVAGLGGATAVLASDGPASGRAAGTSLRATAAPPRQPGEAANPAGEATNVRAANPQQVDPLAPLPKARPKVVAPVAGDATGALPAQPDAAGVGDDSSLPKPKGPATVDRGGTGRAPSVRGLQADKATALPNGVALPPLEAPEAVLDVIRAGNTIARSPYKWGGGHGSFQDNGYDCSGSVSYALYAAGLIDGSRTSGALESWGRPGKGRWITVYANGGHTFMEVAGIRFDTSGQRVTGSRWQNEFRSTAGFVARHPPGL